MKKFLASVCAILFILLAPITVVSTVVQIKFFSPQGVKLLLRASQIGEQLPELLTSVFSNLAQEEFQGEPDQVDPFTQFGGEAVFTDALSKVLPPEDVYAILDQSVDIIFIWWKTGEPVERIPLVIDLSRPKQRLAPIVLESVKQFIEDLPTCTAQQLKEMEGSDLPDVFNLACAPEGFTIDSFEQAGISQEALSGILLASVPDKLNVQEFLLQMQQSDPQQLAEVNRRVDSVRQILSIANMIVRGLQIAMVVCFLMVGLLRLTPGKTFFAWIGWTLFLPGLQLLVLSAINSFIPALLEQNILASNPDLGEIVPITQVITAVTQALFKPILWVGIGMTTFGLAALIIGKILKHRKTKSSQNTV